jgi:hypothetical protein
MKWSVAVWRVVPAISAALLVIGTVAFSVGSAESSEGGAKRGLGYAGEMVHVVAVQQDSDVQGYLNARALIDFCDTQGVSVAYSAYPESGVVGLYDPDHRFRNHQGALFAPLEKSGSRPVALLSTAVSRAPVDHSGLVDAGVEFTGTFSSDVQFDNKYPAVLQNLVAARPGSGTYLVAGLADSKREALTLFFARNGLEIQNLAVETPVGVRDVLLTPYGGAAMTFAALSALAALLVTHLHSFLLRRQLAVAASIGAGVGDLRRLMLARLVPLVAAGTAIGAVVMSGILLSFRGAMQIGVTTLGQVGGASLVGCLLLWVMILLWVSWWETRRYQRALPR